jgi:hypothetical protein
MMSQKKTSTQPDHDSLIALTKKLVQIAGIGIENRGDSDVPLVLEHGKQFTQRVELERGAESECHQNAAELWFNDQKNNVLVTGYALTTLSMMTVTGELILRFWVAHSWILRGNRIIETTFKHESYFGVALSPDAAFKFLMENVVARRWPDGNVPAEYFTGESDLSPFALKALTEHVDELTPNQILDLMIEDISSLGEEAAPLAEQYRQLKKKTLTPAQVSSLKGVFVDLMARFSAASSKPTGNEPKT